MRERIFKNDVEMMAGNCDDNIIGRFFVSRGLKSSVQIGLFISCHWTVFVSRVLKSSALIGLFT